MSNDIRSINEYKQISDLITASLKKGVRTNTAMSREEYEREIKRGSLMAGETPQGLVILRNRASHVKMNYYINDTSCALDMAEIIDAVRAAGWYDTENNGNTNKNENEDKAGCPSPDKPIVIETAFRERDAALKETVEYLAGCGFEEILSRVRLSRAADRAENDGAENVDVERAEAGTDKMDIYVRKSTAEDAAAVRPLLYSSFDHVTGCLPEEDELLTDLAAGNMLLLFAAHDSRAASEQQDTALTGAAVPRGSAGSRLPAAAPSSPAASRLSAARPAPPCGLLHYAAAKKSAEIKHLAISPDMRGRGLSAALINAFLQECRGMKAAVWTGSGNAAALNAYKDCGFAEDGRRSVVQIFRK